MLVLGLQEGFEGTGIQKPVANLDLTRGRQRYCPLVLLKVVDGIAVGPLSHGHPARLRLFGTASSPFCSLRIARR